LDGQSYELLFCDDCKSLHFATLRDVE
jgi:hypothetical protein